MDSALPMSSWLETRTSEFFNRLAAQLSREHAISSTSPAIYDTAWVSMVVKTIDGVPHWRFPEAFEYLLERQLPDGGWETYAAEIDGILNTMAALLAIKRHAAMPDCRGCNGLTDVDPRILKATSDLTQKLNRWDVGSTSHVGFEILVPALLAMLEQDGSHFAFPGRSSLLELNSIKLADFHPGILYAKDKTTLIHSLEAFVGAIDVSSVRHHVLAGSMMASPSATAAYLMHCHPWDDSAEAYLEKVIADGPGAGNGSVPSAFPSTNFELTWSLSTILGVGMSAENLETEALVRIGNFVEAQLSSGGGVMGFAPQMAGDADDTAKAILTLTLLGRTADPTSMIERFESASCFRTFDGERDSSFSANCNILSSLLHMPEPMKYHSQILKATIFLCDTWDRETVRDKWNISSYYPMMLLAQCLTGLLHRWDADQLINIPEPLIHGQVPVILTQILIRVLEDQQSDGSWAGISSYETTAYALLALKATSAIPWEEEISDKATVAIEQANKFLEQHSESWQYAQYIWIEKVTYRSPILSEAYCIAAVKARSNGNLGNKMNQDRFSAKKKHSGLFRNLPLFSATPEWLLHASIIESQFFQSRLEHLRSNVFPSNGEAKPQYLAFIPITWIATQNTCRSRLSNDALLQMMIVSMLVYQADEYFEATVAPQFQHELQPVRDMIDRLCQEHPSETQLGSALMKTPLTNGNGAPASVTVKASLFAVEQVLSGFLKYVLDHPMVIHASSSKQHELRKELGTFLLAHVTQIEDNARLTSKDSKSTINNFSRAPKRRYYDWVRTTSADHTSCPFAFVFFTCVIDSSEKHPFINARQKYLAQDLCRHLATMCRQYNDYGSVSRDRAEGNLNSLDFPEFDDPTGGHVSGRDWGRATVEIGENTGSGFGNDGKKKQELMWLAEYERQCLDLAVGKLAEILPSSIVDALRLFVGVTDLYGQMYVAQDLTSRIK